MSACTPTFNVLLMAEHLDLKASEGTGRVSHTLEAVYLDGIELCVR